MLNLKPRTAVRLVKYAGASLSVLTIAACASDDYYYDSYQPGYAQPVYGSAPIDTNRYDERYQTDRRNFDGINGARVAHRLYSDGQAEELDGDCEPKVRIDRGETISDIAEYCDVPVAALVDVNPHIGNPRYVAAGELINVPRVRGNVYEGSQRYRYNNVNYSDDYLPAGAIQQDRRGRDYYIIRRGDTLAEIAYRHDISLRAIHQLNPSLDPYHLQIGDRVFLPDYARTAPTRRQVRSYSYDSDEPPLVSITPARGPRDGTIRVIGDNFRQGEEVTVLFGQGRDNLTKLKIIESDGDGRINEVVRLPDDYGYDEAYFALQPRSYDGYLMTEAYAIESYPGRHASRPGRDIHVVQRGESLGWIARRYGVSMRALRQLNPDVEFGTLQRGERIVLPEGARLAGGGDLEADLAGNPVMSAVQSSVYYGDEITLTAEGFPPNTPVAIYGGANRNSLEKVLEVRTGPRGRFVADVPLPTSVRSDTALYVAAIEDGPRTIFSERVRVLARDDDYDYDHYGYNDEARIANAPALSPTRLERGNERRSGFFSRFRRNRGDTYVGATRTSAVGGIDSAGQTALAGILTDEGEKCPALRDDSGNLFTLLGDLEGFDDGDRVLVRGSMQADDRICGQAETLQVYEIESAPW